MKHQRLNVICKLFKDFFNFVKEKPLFFFVPLGIIFFLLEVAYPLEYPHCTYAKTIFHGMAVAIIGAGVFAVILKSNQFTELFKNQITKVIYTPSNHQTHEEMVIYWVRLCEALLGKVVPFDSGKVIDFFKITYLNHALDYHFSDYRIEYTIKWLDPEKGIIQVRNRTTAVIVPTSSDRKPLFKFFFKVNNTPDAKIETERFMVGKTDMLTKVKADDTDRKKGINLEEELQPGLPVSLDRIVVSTQSQHNENFLKGKIIRYVQGITIRYKFEENASHPQAPKLIPRFEAEGFNKDHVPGFEEDVLNPLKTEYEWRFQNLLLPNQGYIILLYEERC